MKFELQGGSPNPIGERAVCGEVPPRGANTPTLLIWFPLGQQEPATQEQEEGHPGHSERRVQSREAVSSGSEGTAQIPSWSKGEIAAEHSP